MKLERYQLTAGHNFQTFEFQSIGPKGVIEKVIQFEQMELENLFNLAFGDRNSFTGEIDDTSITDNGDTEKVLATVVAAVYSFTEHHPDAWVYATGSTEARTRLYRMGINKYFTIVARDFDLLGENNYKWEHYEQNKDYQAFAVRRKIIKFES